MPMRGVALVALLTHAAVEGFVSSPTSGVAIGKLPRTTMMAAGESKLEEVQRTRAIKRGGLLSGGALLASGAVAGAVGGMIDPLALAVCAAAPLAVLGAAAARATADEAMRPAPLALASFAAEQTTLGLGLFAAAPLAQGAYLFAYGGERLTLAALYDRYPDGAPRHAVQLDWPSDGVYLDGRAGAESARAGERAPPQPAPLMNHAGAETRGCNVQQRQQGWGRNPDLHFYAANDIAAGEELRFDYGDGYWRAIGEVPE